MPGRHIDVIMDGAALPTGIIVREVHEDAPTLEVLNGERPGRYGQLVLSSRRISKKVAIECIITELFDLAERAQRADALAMWAKGSALEVNYRTGKVLMGHRTGAPALGEIRDYNSVLRVEFTADVVPYWQDKTAVTKTYTGLTSVVGSMNVPGTELTPVCVKVTPTSSTLTDLSVTVAGQVITLEGLSVSSGQTLTIDRDERDSLYIHRESSSLMSARTAASADDLMAAPGSAAIKYTANTPVNVEFSCKGRWS